MTTITESDMRRFWAKVAIDPAGHLLWTANKGNGGYGLFRVGSRNLLAHRFSYEALVGPIPDGLQIDHLCRIRACVAPDCLEPVTPRENTLRGNTSAAANAAKTHCLNGHPFDEQNTRIDSHGKRQCRECQRAYDRAYKAQLRLTHRDTLNARTRARYADRTREWKDATNAAVRARRAARKAPDELVPQIVQVTAAGGSLTAPQVARLVFDRQDVSRAQVERVRSRLDKLVADGRLQRLGRAGRTTSDLYGTAEGDVR